MITAFAGKSGKITGKVTDAETGEPLAAVNIIVEGTSIGIASEINGNFMVLNIPPGTYILRASMIGYADQVIKNVKLEIDLTTTIDIELKSEALQGEEVVVIAKRPVVDRDVSQSKMSITSEEIINLPVWNLEQVVELQAGIKGMNIRGGDPNETAFIVDGLTMNDSRSNAPYTGISLSSIKEIKIETGGFSSEYGNLRSGIINVVTKEGSKIKYSGTLTFGYSTPAAKNFGPSIYDSYGFFSRSFVDPDVCWRGTENGAWDDNMRNQYLLFPSGWIEVARNTLSDNDPSNDLTPSAAKRLYEWRHRRAGDITKSDSNLDFGFGGPFPVMSEKLGNLRFYLSHRQERNMFVYPLSRDAYRDNITQIKITSDISLSTKLMVNGIYGEVHSVANTNGTPSGTVFSYATQPASYISDATPMSVIYEPGYFNPTSIYRNTFGFEISHMISNKTFFEISFQRMSSFYKTDTTRHRDLTKKYWIVPPDVVDGEIVEGTGYAVDESPFGYYGTPVVSIGDQMWTGGFMGLAHDRTKNVIYSVDGDFTSQLNPYNQFKAGFNVIYNNLNIDSWTYNPAFITWNYYLNYNRFPYTVGLYMQDKMEVSEFVINAGVRMDYSNPNGKWYDLDTYNELYKEQSGNQLEEVARQKKIKTKLVLSPRLGVSHPITANSKLYFNYGHFRQLSESQFRFQVRRSWNGKVTGIGNPDMNLPKTVAYELGFEQALFNQYLLKIAAFYKDITEQPIYTSYSNVNGTINYSKTLSDSYEDIRGFELTFNKRVGRWFKGFINYTYQVSTSGYFGIREYYQDTIEQQTYMERNPYQERPHPNPYARANINFSPPPGFGPSVLNINPLELWNLNFIFNWSAGVYDTYNPQNKPEVKDNVQWKDRYNIDLRLSKRFNIKKVGIEFFVNVSNLLNTKYLSQTGFSGTRDYLDYMKSLRFSWEEGVEKGSDRVGEYRDWDVEYRPMEQINDISQVLNPDLNTIYYSENTEKYLKYSSSGWNEVSKKELDEVLDKKAYIDMPNYRYFTFLNPRDIYFGIKIDF